MWLYKEYNNKKSAGQTGKWQHLIHESLEVQNNMSFQGKWYYKGFQYSADYSGSWTLEFGESPLTDEPIYKGSSENVDIFVGS